MTTKGPCPSCRELGNDSSGDNLVIYPDNGAHCFACGYHVHADGQTVETSTPKDWTPIRGKVTAIPSRRISEQACRLYDYRRAKVNGKEAHVANYYRDGTLVAQHLRFPDKEFPWKGSTKNLPLFGQHLWSGIGKRIVITEGEIDCLTVSDLWHRRWPVVAITGASGAAKMVRENLEFLTGYDEVVFCFDMDEPGRKAAQECAELMPPGKARVVNLPRKDANEMVMAGEAKALLTAIYEAKGYQPDGILHVRDIVLAERKPQNVMLFPWDCLTVSLMGQRSGEMTLLASGTGSGKSTYTRELVYDHLQAGRRVGMLMLEESPKETGDDLISLLLNKPVRQILTSRELNSIMRKNNRKQLTFPFEDNLTDEEYEAAKKWLESQQLYIYDHVGAKGFDNIVKRIEYMAAGLQCDVIILDHITAAIAGSEHDGNERQAIDACMKDLRSIVERTTTHLVVVSQLNRLDGKPAEEGGKITLNNLRGSGSLGSVPNTVLALERNQQHEEIGMRNVVTIRALKGRFNGWTGIAGQLKFDSLTNRLVEYNPEDHIEGAFDDESHFPDQHDLDPPTFSDGDEDPGLSSGGEIPSPPAGDRSERAAGNPRGRARRTAEPAVG